MRMRTSGVWSWFPLLALGLALGAPAGAEIYSWRTDDGAYAFTDDPKAIPARYRERVKTRPGGSLRGYKRFTPKDDAASRDYEARLAERLAHLRAMNAPPAAEAEAPASSGERVTLRSGGNGGTGVEIDADAGSEPVVTETVFMRADGKAVVQPVKVTRRGDRVIAIEKPRSRQWNIATDIYDEADLRALMD